MAPRALVAVLLALSAAACGGPGAPTLGGASSASASGVEIGGQVTASGTRGSVLVFAFPGTLTVAALAAEVPLAVATVESDGGFGMTIPPTEAVTLAFLADGSNDGVIDGGDPVVALADARLANLPAGSSVHLAAVALDFHAATARAGAIDVHRPGEAAATPTAIPQPEPA
jgi:hypothetical protein